MAKWTDAQLQAIETVDKTLLISAAAGSGKTTVLIERIIRSLTREKDPADISRMLIVTFTRAAASELRQRISAALSETIAQRPDDKRLFMQLTSLGSAHISTIDSFYSDVVRRNADKLDIPSSLRIADDAELIPLRKAVMDRVIEDAYIGNLGHTPEEFSEITETLCDMRNDSSLAEIFIDLYTKLSSHPSFIEFLSQSADFYADSAKCDFFDSPIGSILKGHIVSQLEFCEAAATEQCEFFSTGEFSDGAHLPPFAADLAFFREAKDVAINNGYSATREVLRSYAPMRLRPIKADRRSSESEYYTDLRDTLKSKIASLKKSYFSVTFSDDDMKTIAKTSAKRIKILHDLLKEFDRLYSEEKTSKGICEFGDVKLWAYKLLVSPDGSPTELADELSQNFDTVYIDEYQDVDLIQDMIFKAVSKPRSRFMVGDIKQSIYGFRGAEPSLFMNYREKFPIIDSAPHSEECTIFMSNNFRCDESIVNFTNLVCSHLFKNGGKEIVYTDGDDLGFSKSVPEGYIPTPVKIALIDIKDHDDSEELDTSVNYESEYIANEITKLTSGERKSNGDPIKFSDVAVLYRSESFGRKVAKALDSRGIPHTFGSSENIFDCPEVSLVLSLLRVIDNPRRDIPLASVLLSPIFGLSAEIISDINKLCSDGDAISLYDRLSVIANSHELALQPRCGKIVSEIESLRREAEALPADKVIRMIYSSYSMMARSNASASLALTKLYENARSYEGDTFKGLYGYLRYIDDMLAAGKAIYAESPSNSNAVNLMTIHKSKGLEFPVCFVGGAASSFNRDDAKDLLLYSQSLGIAMDLCDDSGFGRLRTPFRSALSVEICDRSAEEEMRVLYVALTRARERMYVTAQPRYGVESELNKARMRSSVASRASILDSNSYILWILTAIHGYSANFFEIETLSPLDVSTQSEDAPHPCSEDLMLAAPFTDEELSAAKKHIEDIFSYKYPYLHISNLPAKLSVSKLSPDVLDRNDDVAEVDISDTIDISLPEIKRSPLFMSEDDKISAAQKGIDTHTYLQFCDFNKVVAGGAKKELDRLIRDGFIESRAQKSVNLKQIEAFFSSKLFDELKKARSIRREQRFNILLPAAKFTESKIYADELGNETLLVQGVIDLVFESEDGRLILCDYKTDRLSTAELTDRALAEKKLTNAHRRQLSYYAAAVKRLFGRSPDLVLIYSLSLGDTVAITPENIELTEEECYGSKNKK